MNEPIVCIVNQLEDFRRGCTRPDEHWADLVPADDPDARARHLANCGGCIPRPAEVGFLCRPHFLKVDLAMHAVYPFFRELDGIERAIRAETASRGKPGSQIPIPPRALALDEVASYYRRHHGDAERWVADQAGAIDAVRFARAYRAAERAHPIQETSHQVKLTRCPRCEHKTLVWHPPTYFLGHVAVRCSYRDQDGTACGFDADQTSFEKIAAIEEKPRRQRILVFAGNRAQAQQWARTAGYRPSDWTYIGSAAALDLQAGDTAGRERYFVGTFDQRRDADTIRNTLAGTDARSSKATAA